MSAERAAFVKCVLSRGGFPTECVFCVKSPKGNFCGTAPIDYCYRKDFRRIEKELSVGDEVEGWIVGLILGSPDNGVARVYLPDGEVYAVAADSLKPAETPGRVPVES